MNITDFQQNGNELTVIRNFDAELGLVWRAWTEADLLDQWWAPAPWKSETSHMEFKVGGYRIYAMVGPEGERHVGRTDYKVIDKPRSFEGEDAFCDADGNVNPALPVSKFVNSFKQSGSQTTVTVVTVYDSVAQLQQVIDMGMKEGLSMAYDQLDNVLKSAQN